MAVQRINRPRQTQVVGRYVLYDAIASGGMATVHLARLVGPVGFSRTVAIKRLHHHFATDPEFVSMFLDEARLAARIRHPNVVQTLDVVAQDGDLFLVMDFVQGESLARLMRVTNARKERIPPKIAATVIAGALYGLHAAHEAKSERGEPLGIVHRDVSPQNVLVGSDGISRVLDFGVAKAIGRVQQTQAGQVKGKLAYMAPEQLEGVVSRTSDIYAISVVLWEILTGQRLFAADDAGAQLLKLMERRVELPSRLVPELGPEVDALVMRGLELEPSKRYATAREMARSVEQLFGTVPPVEVGEWVESLATDTLADRMQRIAEIESASSHVVIGPDAPGVGSIPVDEGPPIGEETLPGDAAGAAIRTGDERSDAVRGEKRRESRLTLSQSPRWQQSRLRNRTGGFVAGLALAAVLAVIGVAVVHFRGGAAPAGGASETATGSATSKQGEPVHAPPTRAETPSTRSSVEPLAGAAKPVAEELPAGAARGNPAATGASVSTAAAIPLAAATPPRSLPRSMTQSNGAPKQAATATKPSSKGASDCSVPFTVDGEGIRHAKPECM